MSQKSSVPQAISFVSQVLKRDNQIVYSRPFLRAEIEDRGIVSFKIMRCPQIIVIFIAKTPCDRRRCDGKNQPSHSRECC